MVAFDLPALLLAVGIGALIATSALAGLSMPAWRLTRRAQRRAPRHSGRAVPSHPATVRQPPIEATYRRRVVTGPPATLPPAPARQAGAPADDPARRSEVRAAEELIDELLGTNPEQVARLMTLWIQEDEAGPGATSGSAA